MILESLLIWPLRVVQNFTLSGIKPYKQDDLFFCFINKQSILAPPTDLSLSYSYSTSKQFNDDNDDDSDDDDDDDELFLWYGWPTKGV